MTCEYAAFSLSRDKWRTGFGKELEAYRTKFQENFKLSPNASPGLFGGRKIEFSFRYQGACDDHRLRIFEERKVEFHIVSC